MPRFPTALGLAAGALALMPAAASAQVIEIGQTSDRPPASCPSNPCQAVTRVSGFQVTVAGRSKSGLFVAPRKGRVVAFTIRLSKPTTAQIGFFSANFGGAPRARLSILKPPKTRYAYQLSGQSEIFNLTPYLGREVQFPLLRSLFVNKGYIVALTTPSWVPALALGLDRGNAWRASRGQASCDDNPPPQAAQQRLRSRRNYRCLYRGARLTYSATMVTTPSGG